MDYKVYLSQTLTLRLLEPAIQSVLNKEDDFETVFRLMWHTNSKVAWRAAWLCEKISERHPAFFNNTYFSELISLSISTKNHSVHRLTLSMIANLGLPADVDVALLNACYQWVSSDKYPVAVKALSLDLLYQFCCLEPDLKPELLAYLENSHTENLSPAMISTTRKVIKRLKAR